MANVMTYNGETIVNLNLKSIASSAEYAPGGIQKPYNKTVLRFEGTVGRDTAPGTAGEFTLNIDQIRRNLLKPRQNLLITLEGSTLYNITAPDDANGPTPSEVEFAPIVGTSYALVTGTIEFTQAECDYTGETPNAISSNVVSHNYSVTHSFDDLFLTTRTVTGRIVIRQGVQSLPDDVNPNSTSRKDNPDLLRGLVTPKLPQGFKREAMTFAVSNDGLMLDYDIRDVEVPVTPPIPALRATGTIAFNMNINYEWFTTVHVELEGSKKHSKGAMYLQAAAIASAMANPKGANGIIQSAAIVSSLYSNKIAMQLVTMSIKKNAKGNFFPTTGSAVMFAAMLGSESGKADDLGPYGSATIKAAKMRFFDPCITDMTESGNSSAIVYQGLKDGAGNASAGPEVTVVKMPEGADAGGDFSESSDSIINPSQITPGNNQDYEFYQETISTKSVNGIVTLPATSKEGKAKSYQRHAPYAVVTQQGRAARNGLTVDIPSPIEGNVTSSNVINHDPDISPDGTTFVYASSWIYKVQVPIAASKFVSSTSGFTYINTQVNPTVIPLNVIALPTSTRKAPYDPFSASTAGDIA